MALPRRFLWIATFMAILAALFLAACGSKATPTPTPQPHTPTPTPPPGLIATPTFTPTPRPTPGSTPTPLPATPTPTFTPVPPAPTPTPTPIPSPTPTPLPRIYIEISNNAFRPDAYSILRDTTVTWTNRDPVSHTITTTEAPVIISSGNIAPEQSFSFTFTQPGTYNYICTIHPYMRGKIIVQQ